MTHQSRAEALWSLHEKAHPGFYSNEFVENLKASIRIAFGEVETEALAEGRRQGLLAPCCAEELEDACRK